MNVILNNYFPKELINKIESVVVVLLLVIYLYPQIPPSLASLVKYSGYLAIAILFSLNCLTKPAKTAYVATRDLLPWLLLGLGIISVLWSSAPTYTVDEIDPVVRATLFGLYLAVRYNLKEQIDLVAWMLILSAIISLFFIVVNPGAGIAIVNGKPSLNGIFTHKQYFGRYMALGTITLITLFPFNNKFKLLKILGYSLMFIFTILSNSKSALILLLFTFCLYPLRNILKKSYRLKSFFLISFLIITLFVVVLIAVNLETIVVDILGKNLEFNGRIPVWTLAIEKGMERPLWGHGFSGFWTSDASAQIFRSTWASTKDGVRFHSHNGFIDIFLDLGFVGLVLCWISFIKTFMKSLTLFVDTKSKESFWLIQFLVIFFMANLTEVKTFMTREIIWTLFVSFSMSIAIELKRRHKISKAEQVF